MTDHQRDRVASRGIEHDDVGQSARAGALPEPGAQKLPGNPLSGEPYSPGPFPVPRWVGVLATACAILMVPWIVYLAVELPQQARSAHYDVVWVGFDIAMFAALAVLGWCAWHRSTYTEVMAAITATLLVTDAWFDVVTASNDMRRMEAFGSALLIELPLAALCAWVAQNAERLRRRAYRQLWRLARVEGLLGPVPASAAGVPANSAPTNPAPSNSLPSNPAISPAPSNSAPSSPAPSNSAPSSPAPSNSAPSSPAPSNSAPSNPAPSNPAPSEPRRT